MSVDQAVTEIVTTDLLGTALTGVVDAVARVQERIAELQRQGFTANGDPKVLQLLDNTLNAVDAAKVIAGY